jgi:predicted PurR-regulated permease PerM
MTPATELQEPPVSQNDGGDQPAPSLRVPVDVRSVALTILTFVAVVFALQYAQGMLIPIVLAILASYALEPLVTALGRLRLPRPLAAAIVLTLVVGGGGLLAYELSTEVQQIASQLPEAARRFRQTVQKTNRTGAPSTIQKVQQAATELEKAAGDASKAPPAPDGVQRVQIEASPINISQYLLLGSFGIAGAVGQLILILFLTFFLLASGDLYRRKLVKIAGPSLSSKKITVKILQDIDYRIEQFLLIQAFTSLLVGVASWLAFRWVGLEQAAVWGLMAGVFNSIPYFGPVIVTGAITVVAFLQFAAIGPTVTAAGLALAITTAEGMLLTPWLTSRASQMNAVAIFVGLLFWGWVWSVWGVLLAVPILMALKAVCDHVEDFKEIGELLGE